MTDTNRKFKISFADGVVVGETTSGSARNGQSCREIAIHLGASNEEYPFEELYSQIDDFAAKLCVEVENFASFNPEADTVWYRGLKSKDFDASKDPLIGPNPNGSSFGRYNRSGEQILYLTKDPKKIPQELGDPQGSYHVQKYRLPADLKLLDLRSQVDGDVQPSLLLKHLFESERNQADMTDRDLRFLINHIVKDEIKHREHTGFVTWGVHGDAASDDCYLNLVLWGELISEKNWKRYCIGDAYPL